MRASRLLLPLALAGIAGSVTADVKEASKRVKAGIVDAGGPVRCAQEAGQTLGECEAVIARSAGSAAALITFPNGFSRMLLFSDGAFLRGNATMSGVGTDTDWHLSEGLFSIRVDDQRFEIPQALVFGQ